MKALLDSNVLIAFFRNPNQKEEFEARTLRPPSFMSSVVAMELYAGCRTKRQQDELASFLQPFEKAGRMVTPDHGCLLECGKALARLGAEGVTLPQRQRMVSDVVIAASAARAGAVG